MGVRDSPNEPDSADEPTTKKRMGRPAWKPARTPWREIEERQAEKQAPADQDNERSAKLGEVARLCEIVIDLFREAVFALDGTITPKGAQISLERSRSALIIWSDDHGTAQGRFDHIFNRSRKIRRITVEILSRIGSVLADRMFHSSELRLPIHI